MKMVHCLDLDGDKVLLTSESKVVQAVEHGLPMVYGDLEERKLTPFIWTNDGEAEIKAYDKNTLQPSEIGKITDYGTAIADAARCLKVTAEDRTNYDSLLKLARILQGKIIDDPKRGTKTTIDERLVQKAFPLWMGKNPETTEVKVSYSPMSRLYRWVNEAAMPAFRERFGVVKSYRDNLLLDYTAYDPAELNRVLETVTKLEASYRQDVAAYFEANGEEPSRFEFATAEEYDEAKEQRSDEFKALLKRQQLMLTTIDASTATIGMAAIHAAENLVSSGKDSHGNDKVASYPYVVATDYVMALLSGLPNNFKLVRAKNVDGGLWSSSVEVKENIILTAEGEVIGEVKSLADGVYPTHTFKESFFLKVEHVVEAVEIERSPEPLVQFEIKGYKTHGGLTELEAMKVLSENPIVLQDIVNEAGRWIGVMVGGKQIAAVGAQTLLDANFAKGREMNVIDVQPIKGILKLTARIVGTEQVLVPVEEAAAPQVSNEANHSDEFDMEYMSLFDDSIGNA